MDMRPMTMRRQLTYKERIAQEKKEKELRNLKEEIELETQLMIDLEGQCLNGKNLDYNAIVKLKSQAEEKFQKIKRLKRKFDKENEGLK